MVFFNYATMQMAAKIVYYGPGLCGKTTNLHHIYAKTSPQSRGEMVSLETETDRTLFFDLLPIDVGVIGGFKTRLQLYTIPGQVFYNTTRKLVLKGVDGLVFVADSQVAMLEANVDSLKNLRENLSEIGVTMDDIPLVLQLNKRDLPNINPADKILDALDPERKYEYTESVAATGIGVFETLKLISKLTLRTLRRRMTGEEPVRPAARKGLADVAQFRIKEDGQSGGRPSSQPLNTNAVGSAPAAPPPSFGGTSPAPAASRAGTTVAEPPDFLDDIEEVPASDEIRAELNDEMSLPPEPSSSPPAPAPAAPEPEIEFREAARPKPAPPVKTVKVRSSIDVMAELEALRKKATQSPGKQKKDSGGSAAPARRGREIHKAVQVTVPAADLGRAKSLKVTLSFEDGDESVVQVREEKVELGDAPDIQSVSLNVRIDSE